MFLTEAVFNYLNGFIYSRPQKLHTTIHLFVNCNYFW